MLIVLPLISIVFLFLILQSRIHNWRDSVLSSLIIWGTGLTLITEILSLVKLLRFGWLVLAWLLLTIGLIITYFRFVKPIIKTPEESQKFRLSTLFKSYSLSFTLLIGVAFIVASVGLAAIVAPPNHSDSMEYHMSRVVHWMQNSSVAHYPTPTIFQLYQNPWSEFAIMHFQILSGGDRFANLIQWGSMVGSLVGVSLIARQLGANLRGQILATVICTTIPMGILQASSTNNDYVVAFWMVCFAYFTLLIVNEGASLENTSRLAASLGLAILTKGTAYVYALPFCIWLGLWGLTTLRWKVWKPILVLTIVVLAINWGHYTRNFEIFGSPLGLSTGETNKVFGLTFWVSNITKNLALHADIIRYLGLQGVIAPTTGLTEKVIKILHNILGVDINDIRVMSPKSSRFFVPGLSTYEDTAGNPLHLGLIFIATLFLGLNKRLRQRKSLHLFIYFLVVLAGFLLFCFLFTWSDKRCRLHLPIFILFSPWVGLVLSKSLNYRITNVLALIIIVLSHPWVFNNSTRPLVGQKSILTTPRIEQYFITQSKLNKPFKDVADFVKSQRCSNIGLVFTNISFEYPLWVLLQQNQQELTIRHINVTNESSVISNQLPYKSFKPCSIIAVSPKDMEANKLEKELVTKNGIYKQNWVENSVQVFVPQ